MLLLKLKYLLCKQNKKVKNKNEELNRIIKQMRKKTKWGVSYCVFDGEELLESSIRSIRDSVDYINIVYSSTSYSYNHINQNIEQVVSSLKEKGLVDEIIEYKPNKKYNLQKNEITKRNIGLKYAKKAGVNYFMTMDTDEFYIKEELDKAQEFIIENNITHSFCPIINYGLTPFQRSKEIAQYSVPFFFKVTKRNFLKNEKKKRICISDPTRNSSYYLFARYFYLNNITMHHMSYIRKDLIKKLESSTANFNDETIKNILESLNNNNNFFETENIFNITIN